MFYEHLCSSENVVNGSDVWLIQSSSCSFVYNHVHTWSPEALHITHNQETQLVRNRNSVYYLSPGVPQGPIVGHSIFLIVCVYLNRFCFTHSSGAVDILQHVPGLCIKPVLGLFIDQAVINPRAYLLEFGPFGSSLL